MELDGFGPLYQNKSAKTKVTRRKGAKVNSYHLNAGYGYDFGFSQQGI
jgi:hypothetical protein